MRVLYVFILSIILVGCSAVERSQGKTSEEKPVEGIVAKLAVKSNSQSLNEGFFQANITNETKETFTGSVTFYHSSFKFWTEEVNIPPGKEVTRELKTKYIKHPRDEYTYEIKGDISAKGFMANVDYELFKTDSESAYNVQMVEVSKESVLAVTKELHSMYGDNLNHIGFFDKTEKLEDGVDPAGFPKAAFFGNLASKTITIYEEDKDETFDFEAP